MKFIARNPYLVSFSSSIPFLLISPFHKKSKLIGLQLELKYQDKKKNSMTKLKEQKILHSPSTIMCEKMISFAW
jgi:hypothetical protein